MITPYTSLTDARNLNRAVEAVGAKVPAVLVNVIAGYDTLESHPEPDSPTRAILAAAVGGKLDGGKVDELIVEASTARAREAFRAELRRDADAMFLAAYDRALTDGAADEIIESIRPQFDKAAKVLVDVRERVNMGLDAQTFINTAGPKDLAAYQSLAPAIATVNRLSAVVMVFGMRSITFSQVERPRDAADTAWINDVALMCTEGDLRHASFVFRERPGNDARSSPWMRTAPRLNTIGEAQERIRVWAEGAWPEAQGPNVDDGRVNPYTLVSS